MRLALAADKCSGCRACEIICALENWSVLNPKKAALRVSGRFPTPGRYQVAFCDQCGRCAEVCPTNAIVEDPNGAWLIKAEECIACFACVEECPRGVLYLHDDQNGVPIKCTLCGKCLEFCPTGALFDAEGSIPTRR
ncbi:MAG: 4Fe-4S dicluster domain-containing protein [Bacillota bacterium]